VRSQIKSNCPEEGGCMKKVVLSFLTMIVAILILTNPLKVFAESININPNGSYILIDAKTGQVILEKNADVKFRPASTTKIMTAIMALENGDLNQEMKVSKEAVYDIGRGGMNIGILPEEKNLTLEHMVNVMLIKSANETANIIAENIGQTRQEFIDRMNKRAAELGAANTYYVNTSGKDDKKEEAKHLSTARDMAIIARHAMTIPKFREIVSKEYYTELPQENNHLGWESLRTTNKLMWGTNKYSYIIDGKENHFIVNGIKTGYTGVARNNLVSSAVNEDGMELIAVMMHVTEGNNKVFAYTKELLRYGFEHYSNQQIVDSDKIVKTIKVGKAKDNGELNIVTATDFKVALPLDNSKWNIEAEEHINSELDAPVNQGDVVGYIEYKRNGIVLGKVDVIASRSVEKATIEIIKDNLNRFLPSKTKIALVLIVSFILFKKYFRKIYKKIRSRRNN
jgi:serine-type D-Ala-D-Ala carboxypeptidase (penicillin-binding protein 5/6)